MAERRRNRRPVMPSRLYRRIVERIRDVVILVDLDGRLVYASPQVAELTGYGHEILEDDPWQLFTPEDAARMRERLDAVRAGREVAPLFEFQIIRKDGGRRWVEANVSSIVEHGRVVGRLGVVRDVTARHHAESEAERRRLETERLAEIGRLLSASLDPDRVGQAVIDSLRSLLAATSATIFRREVPSGDLVASLRAESADGLFYWAPRLHAEEGLCGVALRENRTLWTPDELLDPRVALTPDTRRHLERVREHAVLAVPMRAGDRAVGVLAVVAPTGRVFDAADIRLAEAFTDQATVALRNAELYAAAERRATRLRSLTRLTELVSRSLDLPGVLAALVRATAELLHVPMVRFWRADEERRRLTLAAVWPDALGRTFPVRELAFDSVHAGAAATSRRRRGIPDVRVAEGLEGRDWAVAHGFLSLFSIPVTAGDRVLGLLSLVGHQAFAFDADDEELIDALVA